MISEERVGFRMSEINLTDKVALVTGAGRGIGKQIAITLAKAGATVIVNYCGSKDRAEEVVASIIADGGKAKAYGCDVSNFETTGVMMDDIIKEFGKVDILVNNAGITRDNLMVRMNEDDFDKVIGINLKGAFNTIRHLYKNFMKLRSGKIINISSVSGVMGNAGQANYSASKAGIIGLTKSVARELAGRNVCVNAIAPGFVETDMVGEMSEDVLNKAKENIPLKRLGKTEDVANLALFLAGNTSDYITGQVICVDGGMAI